MTMPGPDSGIKMPDTKQFDLSHSPWWARLIYVIGIPSALVLFLTWFITYNINDKINVILMNQLKLIEAYEAHKINTDYQVKEVTSMRLILQQICVNNAIQSGINANDCFQ